MQTAHGTALRNDRKRRTAARTRLATAFSVAFALAVALAGTGVAAASTATNGRHHRPAATRHGAHRACATRRHHRRHRSSCRTVRLAVHHKLAAGHHLITRATPPAAPQTATPASATPAPPAAAAPPVASTAPCADTDLTPDPSNVAAVDAATLCLVNQLRGQHGLPALVENSRLQLSAQRHSDDMIAQDYFAHVGPAGDDPLSRMQDAGYVTPTTVSYVVGENIAWGTLTLSTPAAIVTAWINSPEHLANMLDPAFRDTGMAVDPSAPASLSQGQPGAIYTQDFGVTGTG